MRTILLGPPGAGKGTEGEFLAKELGLKRLSVGAMLRRVIKERKLQGKEIEKYVLQGLSVPPNLLLPLLIKWFSKNRDKFVVDNFPRSREQLELFKRLVQENYIKVDKVFHIHISEETSLKRLLERLRKRRRLGIQRIDESSDSVKNRYKAGYTKEIGEILDYFRSLGILEEVNGERNIEEVHQDIISRLGIHRR